MRSAPIKDERSVFYVKAAPNVYSNFEEEYDALTLGIGLLDRSDAGRLRISGDDALDLLNRLTTNELIELPPGRGLPTVLTSNKGRILDLLHVIQHGDHLLVLTSPGACQKIINWIDFYTIMEDVVVSDVTTETAMVSIVGRDTPSLINEMANLEIFELAPNASMRVNLIGVEAEVYRTDLFLLPGFDIIVADADLRALWDGILKRGIPMGVKPIGIQASEAVRIGKGLPTYGSELSEDFNPLEANLFDLISFTKGCYVGQEVIARLNTYNKVQKQLVGLRWNGSVEPTQGTNLTDGERTVGVLTSVSRAKRNLGGIGLGYVKKALATPGMGLVAEVGTSRLSVEVVGLSG